MKRVFFAVLGQLALLVTALVPMPAFAGPANDAEFCGMSVRRVVALDAVNGSARTWAFALMIDRPGAAGIASGALHIESKTDAYDVRFIDAFVASPFEAAKPAPIVYIFPEPVSIDLAYVASLDVPSPGPCIPFGGWSPHLPPRLNFQIHPGPFPAQTLGEFLQAAKAVKPTDVPATAHTTVPPCTLPDVPARTLHPVPPIVPLNVERKEYTTEVLVSVAPDGVAQDTAVWHSSGSDEIDASSQQSARESGFAAARIKCKTVGGGYIFVVQFMTR